LKNIALLFLLLFVFKVHAQKQYSPRTLVKECKRYKGTPYLYGGNNKKGIDCSGLIKNAFTALNVSFPRVSYIQADVFETIKLKKARKGDLIYFTTSGNRINHSGVVIKNKGTSKLLFIHASTTKGVRIDNLYSPYWEKKLVKITRPKVSW
jgi:cell wall-associated NlpC family hydrolase